MWEEFSCGPLGKGFSIVTCHCNVLGTAVVQVQSLAWELPYTMGWPKRKELPKESVDSNAGGKENIRMGQP